jgi:hypothetical protein
MGFSIKLAPGVRVRASSRGLRTSVGPRAARVHFGAGRTGFSSGAGPVSFYTSTRSGRTRSSSGGWPSTGTSARALANAEKTDEIRQLLDTFKAILTLHRADFPPAQRPMAPQPPPVDVSAVAAKHYEGALAVIGRFNRSARAAAKSAAEHEARVDVDAVEAARWREHDTYQEELDMLWGRLVKDDPDIVLGTLAEAFEDNEAAAAPVGVTDSEASVVVLVPSTSAVPERIPTMTAAGNVSLRNLTSATEPTTTSCSFADTSWSRSRRRSPSRPA